ncbi:glucose-6-phosphate dehydrogenase assembly protein OpcA [Corynebacterium confusum]|uniref:glucose-6-phosphate dehydrogenase assembly protein OpcA n=1 Tax=uncultured Corynebacterium sp. TaxID=159447 RepID=UPI0025CE3595|nr:glucose-6-phosphate dehydrogenase assembly protein OpcA [uncultured Corynebacterium sp.]
MIIPLPDTTTRDISKKLVEAQEHYTLTTGRVLTLIVSAYQGDDINVILDSIRDASHEHPARVLVVISEDPAAETSLDAELRVGGEAGASEIVIMRLHGELAHQAEAVVTPLLLPDTPIVAWWPTRYPDSPAEAPIGGLAQRRITDIAHSEGPTPQMLQQLSDGYQPGDSDMSWAMITLWRGIVASALDRLPHEPVGSVTISGPQSHPAVDLAAGWLSDRLGVAVRRAADNPSLHHHFPISKLIFHRDSGDISLTVVDHGSVELAVPNSPTSLVALSVRSQAEVLAEELRHLDTDQIFANALRALPRVSYV